MRMLLLIPLLLLLAACGGPRKACRKAERAVERATVRCPDLLRRDTVYVELPGDTVSVAPAAYAEPLLDSLQAACQQLAEALEAERALYALALAQRPATQRAVKAVRQAACRYEPLTYEHELFTLVLPGGVSPGVQVHVKPRKASVPCPPAVVVEERHGVAEWYRPAFWLLLLALASYLVGRFIPWINSLPR